MPPRSPPNLALFWTVTVVVLSKCCSCDISLANADGCSEGIVSLSCSEEIRPALQNLAQNAALLSADLTKMTIENFLTIVTDASLREILLKSLQNSIKFAAKFSQNFLQGDRTEVRRTILTGLLDISEQFIDITENFMENDSIASRMSSAVDRLGQMSRSGGEILRKLGLVSVRSFTVLAAVDVSLAIMGRCLNPDVSHTGCVLLLDTKKFVITFIRAWADQ